MSVVSSPPDGLPAPVRVYCVPMVKSESRPLVSVNTARISAFALNANGIGTTWPVLPDPTTTVFTVVLSTAILPLFHEVLHHCYGAVVVRVSGIPVCIVQRIPLVVDDRHRL